MPGLEKRIPGQNSADYERGQGDVNAHFLGTQSLEGGTDPSWVLRAAKAISDWFRRRSS